MLKRCHFLLTLSVLCIAATAELRAGLPLLLEPAGSGGCWHVRNSRYTAAIAPSGIALRTAKGTAAIEWRGARIAAVEGASEVSALHYLQGSDPASWRHAAGYSQLIARELYRGIDAVYYSTGGQLEYDFVLHPGSDPRKISFRATGAVLDADGSLRFANGITWKRPAAYQIVHGKRVTVTAAYRASSGHRMGFTTGAYDKSADLIIDPVLGYATYLGGSLADEIRAVAIDAQGNAYVTGATASTDFPGTTRGQTFGSQDAFVVKVNAAGTALLYATYIGGASVDSGNAIAVDKDGNAFVAGQTASNNFPTSPGAYQRVLGGSNGITDAFALKLSADGGTLLYSTFLGGSLSDLANSVAIDSTGSAYVAGRTDSTDYPRDANPNLPPRGAGDGFLSKLSPDGASLVYSLLIGGFAQDAVNAVAVDASGAAYLAGDTRSDNFPTTDAAFQKTRRGVSDAFVAKVAAGGSQLVYASYLGGNSQDTARAIAVDASGSAYVTGQTTSSDFPVSFNAAQPIAALTPDAFVTKFNPDGASLAYSTFLGGDAEDTGAAIAVDKIGQAYVAGTTTSANFPLVNDSSIGSQSNSGGTDAFLVKLNFGGASFLFSTQFGGLGNETLNGLAIDGSGRIFIAGATDSVSLPVTPTAAQQKNAGATDGFLARLNEITVAISPISVTLGPSDSQQFAAVVSNTANTAVRWSVFPPVGTITPTGLYTAPASFSGSQTVTVSAFSVADGSKYAEAVVTLAQLISVRVSPLQASLTANQTQQFTATVNGSANTAVTWSLSPAIGAITPAGLYTAPATILSTTTVTVRAASVADSGRSAEATLTLNPPTPPAGPVISAAGVTNAASFQTALAQGGIAPGEMITLFGTGLGPASGGTLQLDGRGFVSTSLLGTIVRVDGTPAPVIATGASQISVVVPYSYSTGATNAQVVAEYAGVSSAPITLPRAPAAPGIFTQNSAGSGLGAILNQDSSLNNLQNAAGRGTVVQIYATGEGATDPPGVDGKLAAPPLPKPVLKVQVFIAGIEAQVQFAGGAPTLASGIFQINAVVPETAPVGLVPVQVLVGGVSSQSGVQMVLK